jgi:heme A synthase
VLAVEQAGMLDEPVADRDAAERRPRQVAQLAGGFALLVAVTWTLLVLGALVRAHGAGLACPDWPLCFGTIAPRMDVRVAFEYSHRALAGTITLAFTALATLTWLRTERGDPIRGRLALAAGLLALQILLGALTVWLKLASWTVTAHLLIGNSTAATFAWTALDLRQRARGDAALPPAAKRERRALATAIALLAFQLVLGGLVSSRYAGMSCPEWPACSGGVWFPSWRGPVGLHLLHRSNGYLLLVALAGLARICRASPQLARWTRAAEGLAAAQVAVGIANVLWKIPVEITGLHSAIAAALVLCATGAAHAAWGSATPAARRE